jgi:hypothetical protein
MLLKRELKRQEEMAERLRIQDAQAANADATDLMVCIFMHVTATVIYQIPKCYL